MTKLELTRALFMPALLIACDADCDLPSTAAPTDAAAGADAGRNYTMREPDAGPWAPDWTCEGTECDIARIFAGGDFLFSGGTCAELVGSQLVCWGILSVPLAEGEANTNPTRIAGIDDLVSLNITGNGTWAFDRTAGFVGWGLSAAMDARVTDAFECAEGWTLGCCLSPDSTKCWRTDEGAVFDPGIGAAAQMSLNSEHACLRLNDRTVRCLGDNGAGQLGNGTFLSADEATTVEISGVTDIDAGWKSTCAVRDDGSLWCWGYIGGGLFDTDSCESLPLEQQDRCWVNPRAIAGLEDIVDVEVGLEHVCALDSNGTLFCWGGNRAGQLGIGSFEDQEAPVEVMRNVSHIASGRLHMCAVQNNEVLCWGDDEHGQLGIGQTDSFACISVNDREYPCSNEPQPVLGLSRNQSTGSMTSP